MCSRIDYKIIFFLKWKNFGANVVCVLRISVYVPPHPLSLSFSVFESVILDVLTQPQAHSGGRAV